MIPKLATCTRARSDYRDGYKAHIAVEPETGLVTAAALTPANAGDGPTGVELLAGEQPGLQVLADSAYGSGEVRAAFADAGQTRRSKRSHCDARSPAGSTATTSSSTTTARTATCPAGHTVTITAKGSATFGARCRGCPLRARCTTAKDGTDLTIGEHDLELVDARRAWRDGDFADDYRRWRPMVERSIAWLVARGHAASATAASNATNSASPRESPPSTCADSSTSASPADPPAGRSAERGPGN